MILYLLLIYKSLFLRSKINFSVSGCLCVVLNDKSPKVYCYIRNCPMNAVFSSFPQTPNSQHCYYCNTTIIIVTMKCRMLFTRSDGTTR